MVIAGHSGVHVHHTVHSSSFHVPGRISTSAGQAVQYKCRLYEAKHDCTPNELSPSSRKELSTCHKLNFSNPNIFTT